MTLSASSTDPPRYTLFAMTSGGATVLFDG
jgi:hypothetical protein